MFAISQTRVPTVLHGIPYEPGLVLFHLGRGVGVGYPKNSGQVCATHGLKR